MLRQIALVSSTRSVGLAEVAHTAAALQKQVSRDVSPLWKRHACVSAFARLREVPVDYWPIVIADELPEPGSAGMHLDRHANPYCLVEYGPTWSLAASHYCLEMLIDPSGNLQITGPSPLPDQRDVSFLVEACGPCEDAQFGYSIDGVLVSDFCTPQFFDTAGTGRRCSFGGAIERPLTTLKNGHLSWFDPPSRAWYQQRFFGSQPKVSRLALPDAGYRCLRELTCCWEFDPRRLSHFSALGAATQRARHRLRQHLDASAASAAELREEIGALGQRLGVLALNPRR